MQKNKNVLNEDLNAEFTATVSDASAGIKRLRMANEGSIKENIKQLIDKLSQLNIRWFVVFSLGSLVLPFVVGI